MKRAFLFLLLLPCLPGLRAQFAHGPTVGFGYGINGINTEHLNQFVNSWNTYYQVGMKQPLSEYSLATLNGFTFSVGYRYMKRHRSGFSAAFNYTYGYNSNTKRTVIWSNLGNDFNLEMYNHDFNFEGGYQIKGIVFLHALLGFSLRHVNMEAYTVYADGSRSMSTEYDINGFYQTDPNTVELGASIGARVWHFFIPFRISYGIPFNSNMLSLYDYNSNDWRAAEFPSDWGAWVSNTSGIPDDNNRIPENDFAGLRFHLGVEFMLPLFKNAGQ